MKPYILFLIFWICLFCTTRINAQDTLPKFTVVNQGGKVIVSWVNPFDSLVQISVQRSPDSLKGFKTIITVPDATSVTNGYLDGKAPNTTQFYKIYVQQQGGKYFFSKSQRPVTVVPGSKSTYNPATISYGRPGNGNLRTDSGKIRPQEQKPLFTPSIFVYTNPDGNVVIALPESKSRQYSVKFFHDNGDALFQMAQVKESILTLDKSNFLRSGWFRFELYENNILKEKSKFYIPRDRQ